MTRTLTAAVHQEEDWYVARCLELDVASQGESLEQALTNLREAVELYLEQVSQPQIDSPPSRTYDGRVPAAAAVEPAGAARRC